MMNLSWLAHEMRLQMKNGLYAIYILVNLIYLFLLGYVPEEFKELTVSIIIFTDPTILGMVFIGAFILLEKVGGVTAGIAVSPLGAREYIRGKVFSMLFISLITSVVLVVAVKGIDFNVIGFMLIVIVSSMLFTMWGILIAVYTKTINQYLMVIIGFGMVIAVPLLDYFKLIKLPVSRIIPTYQIFSLIERTIAGKSMIGLEIIALLIWLISIYLLTKRQVSQKLFRG